MSFSNQTDLARGQQRASSRRPTASRGRSRAWPGVGWTSIDRGTFTPTASYTGVSALRESTDETSWWIQVRRSMTETISGSLRYTRQQPRRLQLAGAGASGGVGLVTVTDPTTQLGPNAIYMPTMADRDRSAFRLLLNWMATDALRCNWQSISAATTTTRRPSSRCRSRKFDLYTLDVNYALSDAWNINGYLSTGSQKLNQARPAGYILAFDDSSFNAGIGFNGKASEQLQLGGTLSYISNADKYAQTLGANSARRQCAVAGRHRRAAGHRLPPHGAEALWHLCLQRAVDGAGRCRLSAPDLRRLGLRLQRRAVPVQRQLDRVPAARRRTSATSGSATSTPGSRRYAPAGRRSARRQGWVSYRGRASARPHLLIHRSQRLDLAPIRL